jgi:putative transposase
MGEKTKGRKRHIVVDVLGCLLSVNVHAANVHDTKSRIIVAKQAFEKYPSIKKFCADFGATEALLLTILKIKSL